MQFFLHVLLMKVFGDSHRFPNPLARKEQRQKQKTKLQIFSVLLEEAAEMKEEAS